MSLNVSPQLLATAERGDIDNDAFVATVRDSLPYAWETVSRVVTQLRQGSASYADNQVPPPDEEARGQLLRALASDAIRRSLERHFGVKLAFQNCHRLAAFQPDAASNDEYQRFISLRAQVLNQSPALRNC
jgi:hypothetical protein